MPRSWWNDPNLTPFASRIRDFMLDQRPTLNVADLAKRLREADPQGKGVSQPTIWDWFYKGAIPKERTLELITRATGIPLEELYHLANLTLPSEAPWQRIVREIEDESGLPPEAREELVKRIREMQSQYQGESEGDVGRRDDAEGESDARVSKRSQATAGAVEVCVP